MDGPLPTGQRWCNNGQALEFRPAWSSLNNPGLNQSVTEKDLKIPTLEQAYSSSYTHDDKKAVLTKFIHQIGAHFPEILNSQRDRAASEIHIKNIEEQLNRPKQDVQAILNALQALLELGDKQQGNMMVNALLDYIDEMVEMIRTKE